MNRMHAYFEFPLVRWGIIAALLSLLVLTTGCATAPGQRQSELSTVAIQLVTSKAVSLTVTRDHATPADIEKRAARIVTIASALQSLGGDALASLPAVTQALAPLVDRLELTPDERMQADILVRALVAAALENTNADKYVATVTVLLDDVIRSASYYLPAARAAPPG